MQLGTCPLVSHVDIGLAGGREEHQDHQQEEDYHPLP